MSDHAPSCGHDEHRRATTEATAGPTFPPPLFGIRRANLSTAQIAHRRHLAEDGTTSNQCSYPSTACAVTDPATPDRSVAARHTARQIERIKYSPGALSAQYGADAVARVIHIHTTQEARRLPRTTSRPQNSAFLPSSVTVGSGLSATTVPFCGTRPRRWANAQHLRTHEQSLRVGEGGTRRECLSLLRHKRRAAPENECGVARCRRGPPGFFPPAGRRAVDHSESELSLLGSARHGGFADARGSPG